MTNAQVLVIRNLEDLTPQRHIEFSRIFGQLYSHVLSQYNLPEYPELLQISNEVRGDGTKLSEEEKIFSVGR